MGRTRIAAKPPTCLEVNGPQNTDNRVGINDEMCHALIAGFGLLDVRGQGSIRDPAQGTVLWSGLHPGQEGALSTWPTTEHSLTLENFVQRQKLLLE